MLNKDQLIIINSLIDEKINSLKKDLDKIHDIYATTDKKEYIELLFLNNSEISNLYHIKKSVSNDINILYNNCLNLKSEVYKKFKNQESMTTITKFIRNTTGKSLRESKELYDVLKDQYASHEAD